MNRFPKFLVAAWTIVHALWAVSVESSSTGELVDGRRYFITTSTNAVPWSSTLRSTVANRVSTITYSCNNNLPLGVRSATSSSTAGTGIYPPLGGGYSVEVCDGVVRLLSLNNDWGYSYLSQDGSYLVERNNHERSESPSYICVQPGTTPYVTIIDEYETNSIKFDLKSSTARGARKFLTIVDKTHHTHTEFVFSQIEYNSFSPIVVMDGGLASCAPSASRVDIAIFESLSPSGALPSWGWIDKMPGLARLTIGPSRGGRKVWLVASSDQDDTLSVSLSDSPGLVEAWFDGQSGSSQSIQLVSALQRNGRYIYLAPVTVKEDGLYPSDAAHAQVTFSASHAGGEQSTGRISVHRRPVVVLHGLASSSAATHWLSSHVRWKYPHAEVRQYDYSSINLTSFASPVAQQRFQRYLSGWRDASRYEGTAIDSFDAVGHSMGGLMAKWASQEDPVLIGRVVSIGSPYTGSELAAVLDSEITRLVAGPWAFARLLSEYFGGAATFSQVLDSFGIGTAFLALQPGSNELIALQSRPAAPVFAVNGNAPSDSSVERLLNLLLRITCLPSLICDRNVDGVFSAHGGHDTIVGRSSQFDGAEAWVDIPGIVHSDITGRDVGELESPDAFDVIVCFLSSRDGCDGIEGGLGDMPADRQSLGVDAYGIDLDGWSLNTAPTTSIVPPASRPPGAATQIEVRNSRAAQVAWALVGSELGFSEISQFPHRLDLVLDPELPSRIVAMVGFHDQTYDLVTLDVMATTPQSIGVEFFPQIIPVGVGTTGHASLRLKVNGTLSNLPAHVDLTLEGVAPALRVESDGDLLFAVPRRRGEYLLNANTKYGAATLRVMAHDVGSSLFYDGFD